MTPMTMTYRVVRNDEDQYSLWLSDMPLPAGWTAVGVKGGREECLAHIERVWTDMRPRSLREAMGHEETDAIR